MTHPWDGVKLAPNHYPGQAGVLTLAATLKLIFGVEFDVALHPAKSGGKRTIVKYTSLDEATQRMTYLRFKLYYDSIMIRTLK